MCNCYVLYLDAKDKFAWSQGIHDESCLMYRRSHNAIERQIDKAVFYSYALERQLEEKQMPRYIYPH